MLFRVPILGSMLLLFRALMVFIAANLAVGFTFSTIVRGIMLKANTVLDILPHVWPISLSSWWRPPWRCRAIAKP